MLLLPNEHGDPSFLFPNLSSYNINNQLAKFEKNLSVGGMNPDFFQVFAKTSLTKNIFEEEKKFDSGTRVVFCWKIVLN